MRTYALFNLGRRKQGSTVKLDRTMIRRIKDALPEDNAVIFWAEVNEGDDNDELVMIREMLPRWTHCVGDEDKPTREPISLSPDIEVKREHLRWLAETGVRRWSPQRSLLSVVLADGEVLRSWHPPAGPHTVASRPLWARKPLRRSFNVVRQAASEANRATHDAGKPVTYMVDANHYTYPMDGPGQIQVVHQRTDYGRAWAPEGSRAIFRALSPVEMGIDSHDLLRMVGRYVERG